MTPTTTMQPITQAPGYWDSFTNAASSAGSFLKAGALKVKDFVVNFFTAAKDFCVKNGSIALNWAKANTTFVVAGIGAVATGIAAYFAWNKWFAAPAAPVAPTAAPAAPTAPTAPATV